MSNVTKERLNNRLRLWRAAAGLTLEEVSDLTGLSVAMLSRAERGERHLAPLTRVAVARRLGVAVRELFDVDEIPELSEGVPIAGASIEPAMKGHGPPGSPAPTREQQRGDRSP